MPQNGLYPKIYLEIETKYTYLFNSLKINSGHLDKKKLFKKVLNSLELTYLVFKNTPSFPKKKFNKLSRKVSNHNAFLLVYKN